ncbi:hypothetical protein A9X00_21360 [Mycobacterium sp. 1245805.9]|nr:hypothetical protein A9X00_21360 [Mycobacterium sp. 1245805.9]
MRLTWKSARRNKLGQRPTTTEPTRVYETVILGGGPAGTGALVWAARHGRLDAWLDGGVALVEQADGLGGTLGRYALNADSRGTSFLECLDGPDCSPFLADVRVDPVAQELERFRAGHPTLELVDRFERRVGAAILAEFDRHPNSRACTGTRAQAIRLQGDGSVAVFTADADGRRAVVRGASAVVAIGGRPNASWSEIEVTPGVHLGHWREKIVSSHRLLSRGGAQEVARRLARAQGSPRVVVLGGSHSAFSAAWMLLERIPGLSFGPRGVQILHRSEPRPTYPSRAAAHVDFYEFSESDVCAATGRVHRLGGLQGDGREVWRRMHGKPGTEPDDRAVALPMGGLSRADLLGLLTDCDLIIPALGYRLAAPPIFDARGARVPVARTGPSVDANARLLADSGTPVPGVFAVGLGSGFLPWGAMAGEESFSGQQNSLWLYQNGLGKLIHDSTRRRARRLALDAQPTETSSSTENWEPYALPVV